MNTTTHTYLACLRSSLISERWLLRWLHSLRGEALRRTYALEEDAWLRARESMRPGRCWPAILPRASSSRPASGKSDAIDDVMDLAESIS